MPIVPDTKDWTWVLERPCLECGYDARSFDAPDVPELVRENAAAWTFVLQRDDVRGRPDDETWSPLEYAAHVRDVHRVNLQRIRLMLASDDPMFPNWDQDVTAIEERYSEQDPAVVSGELSAAAGEIADEIAAVDGADWQRPGRRSDGAAFTVETMAKYYLHDVVHHIHDVNG